MNEIVYCNALQELPDCLNGRSGLIFTDENVLRLYGDRFPKGIPVHAMPAGETHKTPETLLALLEKMAGANLRRNSVLVALGGGVVGDIGGLAAALYMRGISCIQIPTTLLAQVDSSVGGKTAVDFAGVKNLVGAFHLPERVLVDPIFLKTLPDREKKCGMGEIIKHGALHKPIFERLIANRDRLFDLDFLAGIVPENIAFKADVVRRDPQEKDLRRCLNLGHTTAHAIELAGSGLSHGECVLWGLIFESQIAERHLNCDPAFLETLRTLCRFVLGAPLEGLHVEAGLARLDKKNVAEGKVVLTVPKALGEYALLELPFDGYARELEALC